MVVYFGWFVDFSLIFVAHIFCWYIYFKKVTSKYWAKRNMPHLDPVFILGNNGKGDFTEHSSIALTNRHLKHKQKKILDIWTFGKPVLLAMDHEIIKNISVRDFHHFHDGGIEFDSEREPFTGTFSYLIGCYKFM